MQRSFSIHLLSRRGVPALLTTLSLCGVSPAVHAQAHPTVIPITINATTDTTKTIHVPPQALPGTVVLMATGDIRNPTDQRDRHNWSDILRFDGHGSAVLVSHTDDDDPADTFAHAALTGSVRFLRAFPKTALTQYAPCTLGASPGCAPGTAVVYDIHSSAPDVAPEPNSPLTLGLGILGVAILVLNAYRSGQRRYE